MASIASFVAQKIKETFRSLLHLESSTGASASASQLYDGAGNALPVTFSTSQMTVTNLKVTTNPVTMELIGAPGSAPSSHLYLYAKSDKKLYIKDSTGLETDLTGGGISDADYGDIVVSGGGTVWTIDSAYTNLLVPKTYQVIAGTGMTGGGALSGNVTLNCSITQYTDEMAQDTVAAMIQNGTGITWAYNDGANTLTPTVTITQYTDELAQDAIGGILLNTTSITWTYDDATPTISAAVSDEYVADTVGAMVSGNTETGITVTYQDADNTIDFVVSDLTVAGDSGSTGMTPGDTLTIAGGTNCTSAMSGDTLTINVDDAFLLNNGDVGTGVYDFGGATSFEIPNAVNPTVDAAGEIALDTDGDGSTIKSGVIKVFDGTQVTYVVAANNYPSSDNDVPAYDSATNRVVWQAQTGGAGGGDVSAASTLTDNAIVRGDGGAKGVQTSGVLISDTDHVTGMASLTLTNTGLHLLDTNASHDLIIAPGSDLTADKTLTITTGDNDRTLDISAASVTVSAFGATLVDDADASAARTTLGLVIGTNVQAYDADLTTLSTAFTTASASGAASLKFHEDTDNGTNAVTLQGPASTADVTVTLPASTGTIALTSDLSAYQPLDSTLTALAAYNTNGMIAQTAADTFAGRTITGTANEVSVSNGDGVAGNPTLSLPATIDLGGKTSLEIPNSAAPTVDADGEIAVDTTVTDFSHGILKYYSGEELAVVALPIAQLTAPTDTYVVAYNATADEFQLAAPGSGGAPTNATYVTLSTNGSLSDERVLTGTANQITVTDGGAGSTVTLSTPQDIATGSSPQFAGLNIGHASDTTITRTGAGDIAVEGNAVYRAGGTDVALADGGTGASLVDPNADRIMFWDDSAGAITWLTAGSGLTITDTTITASSSVSITEAEVDLGSSEVSDAVVTVTDAAVSATSKIIVNVAGKSPSDSRDVEEIFAENFQLLAVPGTGEFSLYVSPKEGTASGKFKIAYMVG